MAFFLRPVRARRGMTENLRTIRAELLQQHADVRATMKVVEQAALACRQGQSDASHLAIAVAQLAAALRAHNAREEHLLRDLLPTIDAWGPGRAETMSDAHTREHEEVVQGLLATMAAPDARAAASAALEHLARIETHMAREEKDFLGAEVLSDEYELDPFGG